MRRTDFKWLLPVWCWALYPLVFLYTHNRGMCPIGLLWRPLSVILALATLLGLASAAALRSRAKGVVVSTAFLALFFAYGHFEAALLPFEFELGRWVIGPNKVLIPIYLVLLLAVPWWVVRTRRNLDGLVRGITAMGLLLCLMALLSSFQPARERGPGSTGSEVLPLQASVTADALPPIYLIVLDAYAADHVLEEMYNFDNSTFMDGLRDRGFFVAGRGRSNYPQSILSITSMLNLEYLDTLLPGIDELEESRKPLQRLLQQNRAFSSLQALGYRTITFDAAGWDAMCLRDSDQFFETPGVGLNSLENELVNTSLAGFMMRFGSASGVDIRTEYHRHRIEYALDKLGTLPDQDGPYFAYAHIGCPHQPFVFDADGGPAGRSTERFSTWFEGHEVPDRQVYRQGYLNQLQYMNKRVDRLLDELLAPGRPEPIILLVSDHGPAMGLNTQSLENTNADERFSILSAVHFPDGDYSALYDTMSSVNLLRVVFNKYFGASLDLLPDHQYFASWRHPYQMAPVAFGD